MSKAVLAAGVALFLAAATPASACSGPHAERYMLWFDLPELLPGEAAIEIDLHDLRSRIDEMPYGADPVFKVKAVLAGKFSESSIRVKSDGSMCSHIAGSGSSNRLIVVGQLQRAANGNTVMIARYMPYPHAIAAQARLSQSQATPP